MTSATERARKIRELLNDPWGDPIANDVVEGVIKFIAAEIEAAEREAVMNDNNAFDAGFRAARERAVEIVVNGCHHPKTQPCKWHELAERIKEMKP